MNAAEKIKCCYNLIEAIEGAIEECEIISGNTSYSEELREFAGEVAGGLRTSLKTEKKCILEIKQEIAGE